MRRLELLLHKVAGQNSKLVSQVLMEMVSLFKDGDPKTGSRLTDLAQFAFNAHKGIDALAAEVERLQQADREHRRIMLDIAAGLETHSKDVCWIANGQTATEAILGHLDPDCKHGDYPECIPNLVAALKAETEEATS